MPGDSFPWAVEVIGHHINEVQIPALPEDTSSESSVQTQDIQANNEADCVGIGQTTYSFDSYFLIPREQKLFRRHTWRFLQFHNQHQWFLSQQPLQQWAWVWDVQWQHSLPQKLPRAPVTVKVNYNGSIKKQFWIWDSKSNINLEINRTFLDFEKCYINKCYEVKWMRRISYFGLFLGP